MGLKLDIKGLTNEILNKLKAELNWAFEAWETEVYSKMKTAEFADNAEVEAELHKESNRIIAYLKANTYVIADSYGTGSLMLDNIPGFQEYRNSDRWNPARTGKAIVGRPEGTYTDAFGKKRKSEGSMEGLNIEGMEMLNGDKIEPISPSYALQDATKIFLYGTYLPRAYKLAIQNVNFAKFLKET